MVGTYKHSNPLVRYRNRRGTQERSVIHTTNNNYVTAAYKHADGKKIDGKRVLVDVERARTVKGWLPRRLGELNPYTMQCSLFLFQNKADVSLQSLRVVICAFLKLNIMRFHFSFYVETQWFNSTILL